MKKILLILTISIFVLSCEKDKSIENQIETADLAAIINNDVYGNYLGIFSTLDSKTRGTIEVTIPNENVAYFSSFAEPSATLTLESGKKIYATSSKNVKSKVAINQMLFEGENFSFIYYVEANGNNPRISNVLFENLEGDIRIAKNRIGFPAVTSTTGTFSCVDCQNHPQLVNNTEYTFNLLFPTGDDGTRTDIESQIIIPSAPNSPFGSTDNNLDNRQLGDTKILSDLSGTDIEGALSWEGSFIRTYDLSCEAAIGTWSMISPSLGVTIEGTFSSTNADDCKEVFLNANFNSFTGVGFSPTPTAGQIDSDFISVIGFSNGDLSFGGTQTSGDYARGLASSSVTSGGIYAGVVASGDNCLLIQPTGSDFTPGDITIRVQNDSGLNLSNVQVQADVFFRNDQDRATSLLLEYSIDNMTFTPLPGVASLTTPLASAGTDLVLATELDRVIPLTLLDNDFVYFRISSNDAGGSDSRDEIAVDNIKLMAY